MKIAVCDDNRDDLQILSQYLKKYNTDYEISLFNNGSELLKASKEQCFDLVFLDIEMDGPDGIEVGQMLRSKPDKPVIVFTTCSADYAVRGYGIAHKYLIKPVTYEEFTGAMETALEYIAPKKICLCDKGSQRLLAVNDILYMETFQHKVKIHLANKENIELRGTLGELAEQVPEHKFAQPHKSYLVNLDYIDRLNKQEIIMTNGDLIPVGRSKSGSFHERLRNFLKGDNNEHWN